MSWQNLMNQSKASGKCLVTLWSTPTCTSCKAVHAFLWQKWICPPNAVLCEANAEDPVNTAWVSSLNIQSVPCLTLHADGNLLFQATGNRCLADLNRLGALINAEAK